MPSRINLTFLGKRENNNFVMIILGLNAYHGDSSACIIVDGKLIAAVEEERFRRVKHWAGFPTESVRYCLNEAGISVEDIDHIALNRNPTANLLKKALFTLSKHPSLNLIKDCLKNATKVKDIPKSFHPGGGGISRHGSTCQKSTYEQGKSLPDALFPRQSRN